MTSRRGYTLLETILVVVVIGVLTALAVSSYDRIRSRTTFSTSTSQLLADLSNARSKARSEEVPIVVVLLSSSLSEASSRYIVLQDSNRTFDLSTYVPGELPTGAKLITDVTLSGLGFDTSLTRVRGALPEPFSAVNTRGGITFAKTGYTGPYDQRATITFQTDGRATFSDNSTTGSFYVVDASNAGRNFTVGVIGITGVVKGF